VRIVNAIAAVAIAACAVVAVIVLRSPVPAAPKRASDYGGHGDEVRKLVAEVLVHRPGSDDHAAPQHPAPIDPFPSVRVGDWRASRVVNDGTLQRDTQVGAIRGQAIHEARSVGDATVTIDVRGITDTAPPLRESSTHEVPRHGATFEQLIANDWAITDFAVTDDTRTIADRAFRCKKIVFRQRDPALPRKRIDVELWLSPDVPVDGFVARHEVQVIDELEFTYDEELVGFGRGSATAWGTRPTDL
jgi:hypothetical protein